MMGGKGDTTFRAPLTQTLSLRGDNPAPPDTLWQRVIYYDFHANGSNPEFEKGLLLRQPGESRTWSETRTRYDIRPRTRIISDCDSIGKPMQGHQRELQLRRGKMVHRWKPLGRVTYNYAGGGHDCRTPYPGQRPAFENMVFRDSLPFVRRKDLGANTYQFKRFGARAGRPAFMPLDGRGFGNEGITDMQEFRTTIPSAWKSIPSSSTPRA